MEVTSRTERDSAVTNNDSRVTGMAIHPQVCVPVAESSQPAAARRAAIQLAQDAGLDGQSTGNFALLVTELATNLVKHATEGRLLMRCFEVDGSDGVEVLSLDKGPGIADVAKALIDGYSTAGSLGTGMGAVIRAAGSFDLYSQADKGTAIIVRIPAKSGRSSSPSSASIGVVHQPKGGEPISGDEWALRLFSDGWICAVADGLGHGLLASDAAKAALEPIRSCKGNPLPTDLITAAHDAAKPTRGAVCGIAVQDGQAGVVRFAGVGNISAVVLNGEERRHLVSSNGVLGHDVGRVKEFQQPWSKQSILLMHSDGIATRWDMDLYPGLLARDPSLIAGVLYRDYDRGKDDATIIVLKDRST
jgi:anti-sigma regulatory factor (Ser/Thr protein kinase)